VTNLSQSAAEISRAEPLRLVLLGGLDLRDPTGGEISAVLAQPKRLALLAYLAMSPQGRLRRRDALLGVFWPEMTETNARNALNRSISFLRGELAVDAIVSRGKEEVGVAPDRLRCDAAEFDAAIAAGDVDRAMQLYAGEFLDGFVLSGASEFENWVERERLRLRKQACAAAWALAKRAEDAKDLPTALRRARQAFDLDRLDEPALRRLLALLDRAGDRLGLAQAYSEFATALDRDFEMEPSPETRRLVALLRARVLTHTSGALPSAMPVVAPAVAHVAPVAPVAPAAVAMTPRPAGAPRKFTTWVVALAIVAAVGIAAAVLRLSSTASVDTRSTIVVLPFTHVGSADFAFFQDEAVNILAAKLSVPEVTSVADPREVVAYARQTHLDTESDDALRAAAKRFHARYVVTGRIADVRGQVRLTADVFDMRAAVPRQGTVDAVGASTATFTLFDTLGRKALDLLPRAASPNRPAAGAR